MGAAAAFVGAAGSAASVFRSPVRPAVAVALAMTLSTALLLGLEMLAQSVVRLFGDPRSGSIRRSAGASLLGFVGLAAFFRVPLRTGLTLGVFFVPVVALIGAAVGALSILKTWIRLRTERLATLALLSVAVSMAAFELSWMNAPGPSSPYVGEQGEDLALLSNAPNPGDLGPGEFEVVLYGSGRDGPRREYGRTWPSRRRPWTRALSSLSREWLEPCGSGTGASMPPPFL